MLRVADSELGAVAVVFMQRKSGSNRFSHVNDALFGICIRKEPFSVDLYSELSAGTCSLYAPNDYGLEQAVTRKFS